MMISVNRPDYRPRSLIFQPEKQGTVMLLSLEGKARDTALQLQEDAIGSSSKDEVIKYCHN